MKIYPFNTSYNTKFSSKSPAFGVYSVCLLDNGKHGSDVRNFAKTVLPQDSLLKQVDVEQNKIEPDLKQVDGLLNALRDINNLPANLRPEYLIMPVLIGVPLLNLTDQMKAVTGKDIYLTPQNLKENKDKIIDFLKIISEQPDKYRKYIDYLDPLGLKIEYTYPLLQEIKKAAENDIKVYIPAGHPEYQSIKYLTERDNIKPELYHYLSTGEDIDGCIKKTSDFIKEKNWYEFNLLELADAQIVKLLDAQGNQHLYSSYDNLETKAKRGIYNLYPVRKNGRVEGYSFTDRVTNQYPDIKYLERLSSLTRFVGLDLSEVLANKEETEKFKIALNNNSDTSEFKNKLFKIKDVFNEEEITDKKLYLKGNFVDSSLSLFFDVNDSNEVIFKNCNYERSDRPSVKSIFGACFSTCNAVADDIKETEEKAKSTEDNLYKALISRAKSAQYKGNSKEALGFYQSALNYKEEQLLLRNIKKKDLTVFLKDELNLAKTNLELQNYADAENHFRNALSIAMQNRSISDIIKEDCSNGLGYTLLNLGKIKEALHYLELAPLLRVKDRSVVKGTNEDLIDINSGGDYKFSGYSNLSVS